LPTTTTTTTTGPTTIAPVTTPDTEPPVTTLIAEVEAAGVDPGPNWSWRMGDTSTECGAITDGGGATGCTSWASGAEKTVFSGSPSLALVAHELANAEAENDAVPSLLSQVAAAEGGTSWSATDAVASCLVEHFLGFQDNAAGTWQCPGALANLVADEIHETVTTTNTTATCGTTSGITSTLTFTGSAGTLTVTAPAPGSAPEVVAAGTPVTVSGIGSFTAVDQGGTISETGACAG
jgi:3D (Asp-Asp-Asp) domain-containing protein